MIIDNRIIFGRGSIAVTADTTFRTLILEYLEPPSPVGTKINEDNYKEKTRHGRKIFTYEEDMKELMKELNEVSVENPVVEFRGYLFDFTEFNPESVKVVKEMLSKAIMGNIMILAC